MTNSALCRTWVVFLSLLLFTSVAIAQTGRSTVKGTVKDPQGNVVAGATVTLSNADKNFSRTQTTSDDGTYVFSSIDPATYTLQVEAAGFKKTTVSDVRALVDTSVDADVALEVGAVSETVNVTSGTDAALNTTDATIGNTFESRRIEELPLNARNIVGLLSLQPGVTREGEVAGSRRDQANITLDGVDVNEQQTGLDVVNPTNRTTNIVGDAFASVLRVTPDSVQEFRVTTANPNATQGRSSGGQVTLVTKSGTNDFHGSLYEYHRNTVTTTNDFFNNARGRFVATDPEVISGEKQVGDERVPRPKLIRNIYGGSIGGPIKRDRFYFFYSFEGRRDAAEESVLRDVPSASLRQGSVRYRCIVDPVNNPLCPASGVRTLTAADILALYPQTLGVNAVGLGILQTAPLPNDFSSGDGGLNRAGFRFNAPISVELETHTARLDYTITDRQSIFFRGNYQNDLYGRAPRFPTTPAPNLWVNPRGFVVGHGWTATNTIVNNLRVGLTRAGVTQQGDSNAASIGFRDVFVPFTYARGLQRTTPVWNVTDDVSWVKGGHTIQFGTNMRFIRNDRTSFANSFDAALVNFSFYQSSGSSILNRAPADLDPSFNRDYGTAVAAVLGRYSQYSIRSNFDISGQPLPSGSPSVRSLATQEYDFYGQDIWKMTPNLTLSYGLRYGVETPVYERSGFQLVPNTNLGEFLQRRIESAAAGTPLNEPISFNLGGPANNAPGFYAKDTNNFQPHIGVAWSPDFGNNFFGRLIGREGRSVFRGGFRILYDHIAGQLAVDAENENSFGFASETTNGSSSTNVTNLLGPLVDGLNPNVRTFPRVNAPTALTFPLSFPADGTDRIVAGIDQSLESPKHYMWNFSYGREIGKGLSFEASYIGRKAQNLLLVRDIMQLNNLRDPASGTDWYTAARQLNQLRLANAPLNAVNIPYFNNLFPNLGNSFFGDPTLTGSQSVFILHSADPNFGFNITDFTLLQIILDDEGIVPNLFFHPQYAALQTSSSVGRSNYNAGVLSVRQRLGNDFLFDFNYTLAKSMDNGSTLLSQRILSNTIRNALNPDLEYSVSDFDVRHNVNANWLWVLPFGRGKRFLSGTNSLVNGILGGWQLSGIFRFNTGLPTGSPSDVEWATNWQLTSNGVRTGQPLAICNRDVDGVPNVFCNPTEAYQSFRNALAGEVGDRNIDELRLPSYISLDAGLSKSFNMWYAEGHRMQFRWEVFNVTNTQRFGVIDALSLNPEPFLSTQPSASFGNYVGSQTPVGESRPGRVMQFALRYTF